MKIILKDNGDEALLSFWVKFWNYFFDPVFEKFTKFLKEILKILKLKFNIFYLV